MASGLADMDPIAMRLLRHLAKPESAATRYRFVNSVESAIQLTKRVRVQSGLTNSEILERSFEISTNGWKWKYKESSGWHFSSNENEITPFGIIVGFSVLVKCLERTCWHLHKDHCPLHTPEVRDQWKWCEEDTADGNQG